MHGHPFPGPLQLWWGRQDLPDRPRNLFLAPDEIAPPTDRFRAGGADGHIAADGEVNRAGLHLLMSTLTRRIWSETEAPDNMCIPAGYTYLLQFIAHDMVDSVPSFNVHDTVIVPGVRNARSSPLLLDTLYGSGPEECPHAYEPPPPEATLVLIPRIRLRVGVRAGPPPRGNPYCPFRDVARNTRQKDACGDDVNPLLTEAMLADPRNDTHVFISQLTVVFQLLHNHVIRLIEDAVEPLVSPDHLQPHHLPPPREFAHRKFQCARLVVTHIYRNIIEKDVLHRILNENIYRRYMTDSQLPIDRGKGIPVEFTFGAFRFGHSMVRERYNVNSLSNDQPTRQALRRTAQLAHNPALFHEHLLPIKPDWLVDWARFFENNKGITPNFSKLIGPHYPKALEAETGEFPAKVSEVDSGGLPDRDLLSAAYAGLLSVPTLIRRMRGEGFETYEDLAVWQQPMREWLVATGLLTPDNPDLERIVTDPPLPFFVLFEAACMEGGRRLGPLGSVIVAQTILGAMRDHPLGVKGLTLKERMVNCGRALLDMADPENEDAPRPVRDAVCNALSSIDEIEKMPELLDYMERRGLFALG
jgi:hypothetical protein